MSFTTLAESAAMSLPDAVSRRRQNWILPHLRGRMALWLVAAPALVATTAAWAALFLVWSPILDRAAWAMRGANPDRVFWDVCLRILLTTGALAVIFGIVALVAARIVSHRVAGPLHRMGEVALQVSKGRHHERVRLRDGDYIEDFAETVQRHAGLRRGAPALSPQPDEGRAEEPVGPRNRRREWSVGPEELEERLRESLRIVHDARTGNPEEETPVLY